MAANRPTRRNTTRGKRPSTAKRDYAALVGDLQDILEAGRARAHAAVAAELVQTYWQLGARLSDAPRTQITLGQLAEDLGLARNTLHEASALFRAYPSGIEPKGLTWSHYRKLLTVTGRAQRERYVTAAARADWSVKRLGQEIKAGSQRARANRGTAKIERPAGTGHAFAAQYVRAVDGDTIILRLDLGFYVHLEQRLRLAAIDAPELNEPRGEEAHAFVDEALSAARSIAVKTHRVDRYGRYVAHVFTATKADQPIEQLIKKGNHLNSQLVAEGLALPL